MSIFLIILIIYLVIGAIFGTSIIYSQPGNSGEPMKLWIILLMAVVGVPILIYFIIKNKKQA